MITILSLVPVDMHHSIFFNLKHKTEHYGGVFPYPISIMALATAKFEI